MLTLPFDSASNLLAKARYRTYPILGTRRQGWSRETGLVWARIGYSERYGVFPPLFSRALEAGRPG